jgi:uncharacterized protein YkwD
MRRRVGAIVAALALAVVAAACVPDGPRGDVFHETNAQRNARALADYAWSDNLGDYAQRHAEWMAQWQSLQHSDVRVILSTWPGYFVECGENIAWTNIWTPAQVVDQWIASPDHVHHVLGPYDETGTGYAVSADGREWYAQVVCRR